jgi:enterochelin esterase family protein
MKRILLFILFNTYLFGQTQFTQFINHVNTLPDSLKSAAVDSFMNYARTQGIPFIEDDKANFIYRGSASAVAVAGDFNSWSNNADGLTKLQGTNFWYLTKSFELNARLDYKFVRNGNDWILDPENPNVCNGGFGPNSELAMPEYVQPWEIKYKSGIEHGTVQIKTLHSTYTNYNYQVKVYLPPGYNTNEETSYPAVYFQDGFEYVDLAYAVNVIDNLIDSNKIQKMIAVFVKPNNRNEEYAFSKREQYRLFFVNELVPFIDSLYKTIPQPTHRVVIGDSYGANISALISYNHPDVFGNCGLHSAAFQPNNYEAYNLIVNGEMKDINFVSVWGTYESLYTNMRLFRDSLLSKGYNLKWLELPEGHSWGLWRATIDVMLEYFLPHIPNDVDNKSEIIPDGFNLYQNYPNPFNSNTVIHYSLPERLFVSFKLYDSLGKSLLTLVNEEQGPGTFSVLFNSNNYTSGVYFYRLRAGIFEETRKMLILK